MAIPSAAVQIIGIPRDRSTTPESLGIVEDFRIGKNYMSEILHGLGTGVGLDGVVNNEDGTISWGRVADMNERILSILVPRINRWLEYPRINLGVADIRTGDLIVICVGVVPQELGLQMSNGRAVRENFRGQCQFVKLASETSESGDQTQGQVAA